MRSMYSAVSSLKAHQLKMDTIGNNIANVGTVGYKGSSVTFKEVFNQTLQGASSAQAGRGGTNPMQVGLGVDVASININHTTGATERTEVPTDVMINGDGFFVVSDDPNFLNRSYTKAGNFIRDDEGNLNTASGQRVLGYMADENGNLSNSIEGLRISKGVTFKPRVTSEIELEGNLQSNTELYSALSPAPTGFAGVENSPAAGDTYVYSEKTRTDEKGNTITYYELNDNFKDVVGRETSIEAYDSLGGIHNIKLSFIKDTSTDWKVVGFYVKDDGNMVPINYGSDVDLSGTPPTIAEETISFKSNGDIDNSAGKVTKLEYNVTNLPNGAADFKFEVDLAALTQLEDESDVSEVANDGYKRGTLDEFNIGPDGKITGSFTNGQDRVLGQIILAKFKNNGGLQKSSENLFNVTANSGKPVIGVPGSSGFGTTISGALEMSNVDLGKEFTNMITTQRGFQANSRVITSTDEMLQELVNMKR